MQLIASRSRLLRVAYNALRISEVRQENIENKLLTSAYLSYTRL